jgi:outer membrane protein TolC
MKRVLFVVLFLGLLNASTLNELVDYAITNSPLIKQANADLKLAKLKRKSASVAKFGEFNLVGDINRYNIERTLAPLPPSAMKSPTPITTSKTIYSIGLNYSVPLFTGFAQTRDIEIAQIAKSLSNIKVKLTKEEVAYNVKSLYLTILSLEEMLKAQKRYTSALYRLKRVIKAQVKYGKKAEIDILKVEQDIENSKINQELTKSNIEIAKASLDAIVGKKVTHLSPVKIRVKRARYSINSLVNKASSLSKVKAEDLTIAKSTKQIQKANAANYPQIALNAYAGRNYGSDIHTDKSDHENILQIGIHMQYNLVDFGKRNLQIEQAKVAKLKAKIKRKQTVLNVKKLIVEAVSKIKVSYQEYLGNSASLRVARKAANIEEVRYQNGVSTINDLLLAKAQEELANAKRIDSKYRYQKSKYYLDYVIERGVKQ